MDRTRAWLAVLPLVAGGILVSHELAYRLTATDEGSQHRYLEHAPQVVAVAALAGLALAGLPSRLRSPSAWPFAAAALGAFAAQEHLERVVHTGELPWIVTSPVFLVGLLLQVPVALLAWVLARYLLAALEPVRLKCRDLREALVLVLAPRQALVLPLRLRAHATRGPPRLLRR